jgi:hypothetical protein
MGRGTLAAIALFLTCAALALAGCSSPPRAAPSLPSPTSSPYTPVPPRAVDLRTASQALSLQLAARDIPVDGLKCRPANADRALTLLRCTVITGGPGHPDQIAEARWNRTAGTVRLISVRAVPSTPPPPLATAPLAAGETDVPAARVTRAVQRALLAVHELPRGAVLRCSVLHADLAGCEVHVTGEATRYFNAVRFGSTLRIYRAGA